MSGNVLIVIFALFMFLFFGGFSVWMLRGVLSSIIRKRRKEEHTTFLSNKEILTHIVLGAISGVLSIVMLFVFVMLTFDPFSPPRS